MPKLFKSGNSLVLAIDHVKCKRRGWVAGQEIDLTEYPNGDIVLKEVKKEAMK